jgi:hypothetical protein
MVSTGGCASTGYPIASCKIYTEKSYAFLEFRSVEEASNCMAFDGVAFKDSYLRVRLYPVLLCIVIKISYYYSFILSHAFSGLRKVGVICCVRERMNQGMAHREGTASMQQCSAWSNAFFIMSTSIGRRLACILAVFAHEQLSAKKYTWGTM